MTAVEPQQKHSIPKSQASRQQASNLPVAARMAKPGTFGAKPDRTHAMIYGHFRPRRHLLTAIEYRDARAKAFRIWRLETCVQIAA